jgi:hypothetical protein
MATVAYDHRQCTRCQEWKHASCFHELHGLVSSAATLDCRCVCGDCFSDWLDEHEAARKREMH